MNDLLDCATVWVYTRILQLRHFSFLHPYLLLTEMIPLGIWILLFFYLQIFLAEMATRDILYMSNFYGLVLIQNDEQNYDYTGQIFRLAIVSC